MAHKTEKENSRGTDRRQKIKTALILPSID